MILHIIVFKTLERQQFKKITQAAINELIEFEISNAILSNDSQIVEQDEKSLNNEKPDETKYLSAFNQRVLKETKATNNGEYNNSAGQGKSKSSQEKSSHKGLKKNSSNRKKKSIFAKKVNLKKNDIIKLSDLSPNAFDPGAGEISSGNNKEVSRTSDYLKDVEDGAQTYLNTREFIYYAYYKRIRSKIRYHWEDRIKQKVTEIIKDQNIAIARRTRLTKVIIVLNDNGRLVGVQIVGRSGIEDLDDAAVEAFKEAEPFPNPPKDLVESDGRIRINWDFVLDS